MTKASRNSALSIEHDPNGVVRVLIKQQSKGAWMGWLGIIMHGALTLIMLAAIPAIFVYHFSVAFLPIVLFFLWLGYRQLFDSAWTSYGYETLELGNEIMIYQRKWWLFTRKRKFSYIKMKALERADRKAGDYMGESAPLAFFDTQIRFKHGFQKQMIGKKLEPKDSKELFDLIATRISQE